MISYSGSRVYNPYLIPFGIVGKFGVAVSHSIHGRQNPKVSLTCPSFCLHHWIQDEIVLKLPLGLRVCFSRNKFDNQFLLDSKYRVL